MIGDYGLKEGNAGLRVHASIIEDRAYEQVWAMVGHPALRGLSAYMPDIHYGEGGPIGFTGQFDKAVIPNIVGYDGGCGVMTYLLSGARVDQINFAQLDKYLRDHIPLGKYDREMDFKDAPLYESCTVKGLPGQMVRFCEYVGDIYQRNMIKKTISPLYQLGSLGGGNHFIELNVDSQENVWATVHTGSRNFGHKIATHFQAKAKEACHEMGVTTPKGLEYLPMSFGGCLYLEAEHTAQTYAHMNRTVIISVIASFFGIEPLWMHTKEEDAIIESVHNYIGDDGIIRKGAISAKQGEKVVIPLTMKRGIVIGTGKGNKDFNYSAPHGCGRVHGRKAMDRLLASSEITMDQYRDSMQGIFSTSICEATIDECDAAYKDFDQIRIDMEPTVDIEEVLRPIYSLKDDSKRDKKAKVL